MLIASKFKLIIMEFILFITLYLCPLLRNYTIISKLFVISMKGTKTMFRIIKGLEQCLKEVSLYACNYVAKSHRYSAQYLTQWKRLAGKDEKSRKRKQKLKQKEEKQKLRHEIRREKHKSLDTGKHSDKENQRRRQRQIHSSRYQKLQKEKQEKQRQRQRQRQREEKQKQRVRQRERQIQKQRQRQKQRQIEQLKQRQKEKGRQLEKDRYKSQEKQKQRKYRDKPVSSLEKQRQLDFDKDFDFKGSKKSQKNPIIFEESGSQNQQCKQQKKPEQSLGWSKKIHDQIGSKDLRKYKILRIDQAVSDFQDQNAPLKVPQIKPRHPLTPYFLFLRKMRCIISKRYPVLDQHGTVKNIWQNMQEQQKKPYTQEYQRACRIYEKKLSQYKAVNPEQDQVEERMEKVEKKMKKSRNQEPIESGKRKRNYEDEEQNRPRKKKGGLQELDDYEL